MMKSIGRAMYFLTFVYFFMMFVLPSLFVQGECGDGVGSWVFYLYGVQAFSTGLYEGIAVKLIERKIQKHDKSIL